MRFIGSIRKIGILLSIAALFTLLVAGFGLTARKSDDPYAALRRQDFRTASTQFQKLASQGVGGAQFALATLYFYGKGVPQDYAEAMKWFREAAKQGDANADFAIGAMYISAQGVPKNPSEAATWYRRAAELGHARAQVVTAFNYSTGEGVSRDDPIAARWFYRAAQQGAVDAQIMLSSIYAKGTGVPVDNGSAYAWATVAAARAEKQEFRDAAVRMQEISSRSMGPGDIIEAQKLALAWKPQPEPGAEAPSKATLEQGGIQANLFLEGDQAVVRWRLLRPIATEIPLAGDINGKPLGILSSESYPPPGARTSVVLLLDVSDPARQADIDSDKLKIADIVKHADAQHEIDVAVYANDFRLLQPKDSSAETIQALLAQTTPLASTARLGAALKSAMDIPSLVPAERRGIFVFHDGHSEDAIDTKSLIDSAKMRHTTLNFVITPGQRPIDPSFAALADATGGLVVTASSLEPFLQAPFWPLDSGGTVRVSFTRAPRPFWQSEPVIRFVFHIGANEVVLKAPTPVPVAGIKDTAVLLANDRPLAALGSGAAILILAGGLAFGISRRRKKTVGVAPMIDEPLPRQRLALLRNETDGATYPIRSRIVQLGRGSDAHIRLKDETVSRIHALLRQLKSGAFEIENRSGNGTFVNNQKVEIATLEDGDLVTMGLTTLRYLQLARPDEAAKVAPAPSTTEAASPN